MCLKYKFRELFRYTLSPFCSYAIVDFFSSSRSFIVSESQSMASTTSTNTTQPTNHTIVQPQLPLLLLSNMSNLMSIKLDYTNYIPLKHQLITILEAYSLIEHIDGHGHAIFGVVSVSDTCRTLEQVRLAGFRCPASIFFLLLRHGSDATLTR